MKYSIELNEYETRTLETMAVNTDSTPEKLVLDLVRLMLENMTVLASDPDQAGELDAEMRGVVRRIDENNPALARVLDRSFSGNWLT